MSRRTHIIFGGAAAALAASAAVAAFAQAPGPDAARVQQQALRDAGNAEVRIERHGDRTMVFRTEHPHRDPAEHLRTVLQLKPGQEAALKAYLDAIGPPHHEMIVRLDHDEGPRTTPERLAEMEKMLAEHDQRVHAQIEATRRFYAQLDPAQQKAFDELGLAAGHMGMMRMVSFMPPVPPMPPMPHMPPMPPHPPAPPAPPSF
jgi:hypothetical protein